jgi:hypothetical protein
MDLASRGEDVEATVCAADLGREMSWRYWLFVA